ncbi:MAG: FISUMP domain-containing protein [Bacteroidota bacterium]
MKTIYLFFSLLPCYAFAQTLTDERDGETYAIVQIGDRWWMNEDLRFCSEQSYCVTTNRKDNVCNYSNFYSRFELDSICPEGWRIPTLEEWNAMIDHLATSENGTIMIDTLSYKDNSTVVHLNNFKLDEQSLLYLNPTIGWVEGKRRIEGKSSYTLWVKDSSLDHDRFHIHIGKTNFVQHHHTHHLLDKARKQRRFCMRCVKQEE